MSWMSITLVNLRSHRAAGSFLLLISLSSAGLRMRTMPRHARAEDTDKFMKHSEKRLKIETQIGGLNR